MVRGGSRRGGGSVPLVKDPARYKTELCSTWMRSGGCPYGHKCQFAHGVNELRARQDQPSSYKTKVCRSFLRSGRCPYGARCRFVHGDVLEAQQLAMLRLMGDNPELLPPHLQEFASQLQADAALQGGGEAFTLAQQQELLAQSQELFAQQRELFARPQGVLPLQGLASQCVPPPQSGVLPPHGMAALHGGVPPPYGVAPQAFSRPGTLLPFAQQHAPQQQLAVPNSGSLDLSRQPGLLLTHAQLPLQPAIKPVQLDDSVTVTGSYASSQVSSSRYSSPQLLPSPSGAAPVGGIPTGGGLPGAFLPFSLPPSMPGSAAAPAAAAGAPPFLDFAMLAPRPEAAATLANKTRPLPPFGESILGDELGMQYTQSLAEQLAEMCMSPQPPDLPAS